MIKDSKACMTSESLPGLTAGLMETAEPEHPMKPPTLKVSKNLVI